MVLQQNPERKVEALILARFSEFIRLAHIPKGFRFSINKRSDKNNISLDVRHKMQEIKTSLLGPSQLP